MKIAMTIDDSIRLLEDYHKYEKQFGTDGSGIDNATNKLLEVAKKYQKIQEIMDELNGNFYRSYLKDRQTLEKIYEVIEDEPGNNHHASNT